MQESNQSNIYANSAKVNKYSLGVTFGLITSLVYIVVLLIRYNFFAYSYQASKLAEFAGYFIILCLYFIAGYKRKKQLGEYSETREIFLTIFITIVITEAVYVLFTFIYLTYIDPAYTQHYTEAYLNYLKARGKDTLEVRKEIKEVQEMTGAKNFTYNFVGWAIWVIIDSIIGLIFSLALRKPKPQYY